MWEESQNDNLVPKTGERESTLCTERSLKAKPQCGIVSLGSGVKKHGRLCKIIDC